MGISYSLFSKASTLSPPGIALAAGSAFVDNGKYYGAYVNELVGTLLMIGLTFSPGKWIGQDSLPVAWVAHAIGVVLADYIGGGPNVNPAVSVSMFALGKFSYTEMYVRIAGAMTGGLVAFPLFQTLTDTLSWEPLGGPEFSLPDIEDDAPERNAAIVTAFYSEFFAMFLLMFVIYILNWELNFGKFHYWIKQPLTAIAIRYLIEVFPTAGPAMNPMLGTAWATFASGGDGGYPMDAAHYFVYWLAPCLAAVLASFVYVVYAGGTFFGETLPFGPIKKQAVVQQQQQPQQSKKKKSTKKE